MPNGPNEQSAGTSSNETAIRIEALVAVLYAFVVFMSLVYLGLASRPGEFDELHTRIDALYFTMSTIATVGFGDVHATGQAARLVVTVQIFLDLIFVGLVARIILPSLARQRAQRNETRAAWTSPDDDPMDPPGLTPNGEGFGPPYAVGAAADMSVGPGRTGDHGLAPAGDAELAVERLQVHLHGVDRHEQLSRDLLVAHHARQELQHRELAVGERDMGAGAVRSTAQAADRPGAMAP